MTDQVLALGRKNGAFGFVAIKGISSEAIIIFPGSFKLEK